MAAVKRTVSRVDTVPVGPTLSMFDPVYLGIDESGEPVYLPMAYNNLLVAGQPGAGKSVTLSLVVAHAALSLDCRLCLIDGKQVELGLWRNVAIVWRRTETADTSDDHDDETTLVIATLAYAGSGWRTLGDALLANTSAAMARERQRIGRIETTSVN